MANSQVLNVSATCMLGLFFIIAILKEAVLEWLKSLNNYILKMTHLSQIISLYLTNKHSPLGDSQNGKNIIW